MSTIVEQVARTLWVTWWAREHECRREEDPGHEMPWGGGDDVEEVAPPTPPGAYVDAGRVVGMVEERNGIQIDEAWARALMRDGRDCELLTQHDREDSKKEFGWCLAMEVLGSEASWRDDHEDWGLEVPRVEPGHMPDVFAEVPCGDCLGDAGEAWDRCDECQGVVCRGCRVEEVLCAHCREKRLEV